MVVQLTPRRAWQVKLDSGPTLELGRHDIEARLAQFVAVHARTVGTLNRHIDYIDLRYPNGFAVRIPELKNAVWPERPAGAKPRPKTPRRHADNGSMTPEGAAAA